MMTRFMMWCYTWVLGLVVMMAGTGAVENPNGHVVAGVVVMYLSLIHISEPTRPY